VFRQALGLLAEAADGVALDQVGADEAEAGSRRDLDGAVDGEPGQRLVQLRNRLVPSLRAR
jgi:hypothetical protein